MHIIFIIDEERDDYTTSLFSGYLRNKGFDVIETYNAEKTLTILRSNPIDLVILEYRTQETSGLDILGHIRSRSAIPIVIVSHPVQTERRVEALEAGADDFIVKPFDPAEVTSRILAIIRRSSAARVDDRGDLEYRFNGWRLRHLSRDLLAPDGSDVPLTPAEFNLLAALAKSPMRVLSRDQLLDSITRGDEAPVDRAIDVLVSRIRKKMSAASPRSRFVETVQGFGYRFGVPVSVTPDQG